MSARPDYPFSIALDESANQCILEGSFVVSDFEAIRERLTTIRSTATQSDIKWNLLAVSRLDSPIGLLLWSFWNGQLPSSVELTEPQRQLFRRIAQIDGSNTAQDDRSRRRKAPALAEFWRFAVDMTSLFGRFWLDLYQALIHPSTFPLKELSAAAYRSGVTAVPVVCVVGFLIGIVLSYLSSLQLREYGAESFLPLILGIGVVRELGPLLAAIVIAGRSGSAITAGIAAMRLTQELDALSALGITHSMRLVLPKTLALAIAVPLLVVCTNLAALLGGMLSGWFELDFSPASFVLGLHQDVALIHFNLGLFKSVVFGLTIGIIACLFGLRAQANTQSLSTETTRSVVTSISAIIVLDALFAIIFKDVS